MKNMKKIFAVVIALALVCSLAGCFGVPSSMMPEKWIDTIDETAATVDFAKFTHVDIKGTINGAEVSVGYDVSVNEDMAEYTLDADSASTDSAVLSYISEEVLPYGLLSTKNGEKIIDYIFTLNDEDSDTIDYICILGKFTFSKNYVPDGTGIDNLSLYTWSDTDLSLSSFSYTETKDEVAGLTNELTLSWS